VALERSNEFEAAVAMVRIVPLDARACTAPDARQPRCSVLTTDPALAIALTLGGCPRTQSMHNM